MINFVSHLPRGLSSGGFAAAGSTIFAALASRYETAYAGPINPPTILWQKALSKALRLSGRGGDFFAFSERRLAAVADQVALRTANGAALDVFHGFTPWTTTRPTRPFVAWSDCSFHDYIDVFHDRSAFRSDDLARIEQAEARWLKRASRVLFSSRWAAARATGAYGLDPARVQSVGIFGEFEPPQRDVYAGEPRFAFVSTDFAAKGGPVAVAALGEVRRTHPEARLTIVGAPPAGAATPAGVDYAGYLHKEAPAELARFRAILASSVALAHPTRSDITPHVVVEAGLFGCPAIASRAFAIPELVEHGRSGWLLDDPADPQALAAAMRTALDTAGPSSSIRAEAWRKARADHSKAAFQARLLAAVEAALGESQVAAA